MKKVIIVGGGVCGLTAAYRLKNQGFDVEVLDARNYSGGRTHTVTENGFKVDQGASLLVSSYVEALELAKELGLSDKLDSVPASSMSYINGRFYPMKMDDNPIKTFLFSTPYLSFISKLSMIRMLPAMLKYRSSLNFRDISGAAGSDVETAEEYCKRLMPSEVYDRFINPLLRGMYIANGDAVSATQLLWIVTNFSGVKVFGFTDGMQSLANALADRVPVKYGVKVQRVNDVQTGVEVRVDIDGTSTTLQADYCIIATDGKDLKELYGHALSERQNNFLSHLTYAPIKMVTFLTKRRPKQEAVLAMPTAQDDPDLALIVMDHLYGPSRAPEDMGMISFLAMHELQKQWLNDPEHKGLIEFGKQRLAKYFPDVVDAVVSIDTRAWLRASTVGVPKTYRYLKEFVNDIKAESRVLYTGDYMAASSVGVAAATGNAVARRLIAQCSD
jgi:oxygen-dependent protoporphyrinogen oxidase